MQQLSPLFGRSCSRAGWPSPGQDRRAQSCHLNCSSDSCLTTPNPAPGVPKGLASGPRDWRRLACRGRGNGSSESHFYCGVDPPRSFAVRICAAVVQPMSEADGRRAEPGPLPQPSRRSARPQAAWQPALAPALRLCHWKPTPTARAGHCLNVRLQAQTPF